MTLEEAQVRIKELESDISEMNQTIEYYQVATLKAERQLATVQAEAAMTACALSELEAHLVLTSAVHPAYSAPWLKTIREALARSTAPEWLKQHDQEVQRAVWGRFEERHIGDQDILGGAFVKSIILKISG